ncbi:hypothetical protein [Aliikangiella coralliicola]|uniref:Uncharacterized protein n=1 Tax=Aliikangiella coralliicola TaxID=2592383 RepID=A0A545U909_9GAMM|nr:hypothetical protein [Aliikangiella coralliicola]TQV85948.1 hypothetical protein FLL46_18695 [Aliikangiella coralliicola]
METITKKFTKRKNKSRLTNPVITVSNHSNKSLKENKANKFIEDTDLNQPALQVEQANNEDLTINPLAPSNQRLSVAVNVDDTSFLNDLDNDNALNDKENDFNDENLTINPLAQSNQRLSVAANVGDTSFLNDLDNNNNALNAFDEKQFDVKQRKSRAYTVFPDPNKKALSDLEKFLTQPKGNIFDNKAKNEEDAITDLATYHPSGFSTWRTQTEAQKTNWIKPTKEVSNALQELKKNVQKPRLDIDQRLSSLLDVVYSFENNGLVSAQILNDLFYLTDARLKQKLPHPMNPSPAESNLRKNATRLRNAIGSHPLQYSFLSSVNAEGYNAYLLSQISSNSSLGTGAANVLKSGYYSKVKGVSFIRNSATGRYSELIRGHRKQIRIFLSNPIDALGGQFKSSSSKIEEIDMLQAGKRLKEMLAKMDNMLASEPNKDADRKTILELDLAIAYMQESAKSLLRTKAAPNAKLIAGQILDYLDLFTMSDIDILNQDSSNLYNNLNLVRENLLATVSKDEVAAFDKFIERLHEPSEPEKEKEHRDKIMKELKEWNTAYENALYNNGKKPSKKFKGAGAQTVSYSGKAGTTSEKADDSGPAFLSDAHGNVLLASGGAVGGAYELLNIGERIYNLSRTGGVKEMTYADKGKFVDGALKTIKYGANITDAFLTTGGEAAAMVGNYAAGVIAAGVVVQSGVAAYKTVHKIKIADEIDSPEIRAEIRRRLKRKEFHMYAKMLGGTLAFVGGTLLIVGTAGIAAPVVAAAGGVVMGLLLAQKSSSKISKALKGTLKSREEFAETIITYMQKQVKEGHAQEVQNILKSLANDPLKRSAMLKGIMADDKSPERVIAAKLITNKLKTW